MPWFITALLAALAVPALAVNVVQSASKRSSDDSLSLPIQFSQKLLVCNAVSPDSASFQEGVSISRNDAPLKSGKPLPFNACRYVDGKVRKDDRLNFVFEKEGVQGTFEVDEVELRRVV